MSQGNVLKSVLRASTDSELIDVFLASLNSDRTREAYALAIDTLIYFLDGIPLESVTVEDAIHFRDYIACLYSNVHTQNLKFNSVKSLFAFASSFGYLDRNAFHVVRTVKAKEVLAERILTEDEVSSMIEHTKKERDKLLILLLYASAARVSEICDLKWRDVQSSGNSGQVVLFGKCQETRVVKLSQKTWMQLSEYGKGKDRDAPVFYSQKGGHLDASQVQRIVRKAGHNAGIDRNVSPHWLRHSHASHALEHGAPINLVRDTLGHSSISTTNKYAHARPDQSSALHLTV